CCASGVNRWAGLEAQATIKLPNRGVDSVTGDVGLSFFFGNDERPSWTTGSIDKARWPGFDRARMKHVPACWLFLFLVAITARAGTQQAVQMTAPKELANSFAKGAKEVQNVTGAFFFTDNHDDNRPSIDYALDTLRLGVILNDPWTLGLLSGNFEFLGEIFLGHVVNGPGNILAGGSLIIRYNFVQPRTRVIPYLQIAAGGVYTDIPEDESRGLISLPVEFNLQGGVGTRLMLNDRWSIVLEATYRHISNAEIKK